ncbi:DNA-processing protein DprA [Bisgaard Taxon 45]
MSSSLPVLLRLLQVPRLGPLAIQRLLDKVSLATLTEYDATAFHQMGWTAWQIQRWFSPEYRYIDPALAWTNGKEQHIVDWFDPHYPPLLKQTVGAPLVLFVKGEVASLSAKQVAIVGSRHCSHYGEYWANYFATQLAYADIVVTSGLALGIDSFAHQAVVDIKGRTVAVLGSGLDVIYPKKHRALAENIIAQRGALVSEFLPSQPPVAENFPRRNRIISGLSLGTLVIEASEHSGSLITARYALEQNREVFALPGQIQQGFSQGCHKLIKQGAILVEQINDILEHLPLYQQVAPIEVDHELALSPTSNTATLKMATTVPDYPDLYAHIGYSPVSIDVLAQQVNLPINTLLVQLLALELQELIVVEHGLYKRR